jgi:plastocyanin
VIFSPRRVLGPVLVGVGLSVHTGAGASAQVLGPSISINIVEPRAQSRWGYAPATRQVAQGTWVTWSNAGQDAHTVTADDGTFDSGNLDPSEGFAWYFDQDGTWQYTCTLHPWMVGTIIVGDGGAPTDPASDADS